MKKFLSMILALALVLSLGTVAFAEVGSAANSSGTNIEEVPSSDTQIQVGLNYTKPESTPDYYVTVKWESMQFKYENDAAATDWNPTAHDYDTAATEGKWTGGGAAGDSNTSNITITNHSNVKVKAKAEYVSSDYKSGTQNDNGVTVTCAGIVETPLEEGTLTNLNSPDANETMCSVKVDGKPNASLSVVAGTVTVTISANT